MAISFIAASSGDSGLVTANPLVINKPTNTADGDVLIMHVVMSGGTGETLTPAGWTSIQEQKQHDDREEPDVLPRL